MCLAIAWVQLFAMLVMIVCTMRAYRALKLSATKKEVTWLLIGWLVALVVLPLLMIYGIMPLWRSRFYFLGRFSRLGLQLYYSGVSWDACFAVPFFHPGSGDAQIFVILFLRWCRFLEKKVLSKRALEVGNRPRHEILRFKSGQLLRNLHKILWFKRRNPGSKKPGNG